MRQYLKWFARWGRRPPPPPATDLQRAQALIRAVDAGGLPLSPAIVNQIARGLGLEVSRHAPVEDSVARIRAWLGRG